MAHGLSIYIVTAIFLVLATACQLTSLRRKKHQAVTYAIIMIGGTWAYQIETGLIDELAWNLAYRGDQILNALVNLFERRVTSAIQEQQLHLIEWYDVFITPMAYAYVVALTFVALLYFLLRFIKTKNASLVLPLTITGITTPMFTVAFVFAYKGIENAIARYLYVYAIPLGMISTVLFFSKLLHEKRKLAALLLIITFIVGIISMTESFYSPYASISNIPDNERYGQLYSSFYGPRIYKKFLDARAQSIDFEYSNFSIHTSHESIQKNQSIIYNNGLVMATSD